MSFLRIVEWIILIAALIWVWKNPNRHTTSKNPGSFDLDRIRNYVKSRGGELIDAHWEPLTGSLNPLIGDLSPTLESRVYKVRYIDADGNQHEGRCDVDGFGANLSFDSISKYADRKNES